MLLLSVMTSQAHKLHQAKFFSPLQQPDEFAYTGVQIPTAEVSDQDIKAYSMAVSNGGNAATMLKEMEPKPVKAEEDAGTMALLMESMANQGSTSEEATKK